MLEKIVDQLGVENPLMVGDSGSDVEVARRAGFDSCLVNPYKQYTDISPAYRLEELEELKMLHELVE